MEFQVGDLVTYKDQFTQNGNFDGANVIMVLKTKVITALPGPRRLASGPTQQRIFIHNLKKGIQGWDFASSYVKMPST